MAFCRVEFYGESIQKMSALNVLVPEREGRFPVLLLLHGLSDDQTAWCRRTSIERYADELDLIVAMPDGHRSFYCNDPRPGGCAYEDHIVKDVLGFVERTFPAVGERGARALAGLSMGGYGAMMLALRHPDVFCAASSHSGALGFAHGPIPDRTDLEALADALPEGEYDCHVLAERLQAAGGEVALRFDCGQEDFLVGWNRKFHSHLERLGIAHEYQEFPGDHNWAYWDEHIRQTLAFVTAAMARRT